MKKKYTIFALCACSIAILPAQTATPEKPAAEAQEEVKPEGPFEERAFDVFKITSTLPEILESMKDDASISAAQLKLDAMSKKLDAHITALEKMDAPPNEARIKLTAKVEPKKKVMDQKMQKAMASMRALDEETGMKAGAVFSKFGQRMQKMGPVFEKYFAPDPEDGE